MKKSMSVLSLLVAGALVTGGASVSHADELKVSGFADIKYIIINDAADNTDVSGTQNPSENTFGADAEVDFEKKQGAVTFRMDIDLCLTGGVCGATDSTDSADIEQANFTYQLPVMQDMNLNLQAGVFNSPIGFESQDSPDMLQASHGQLWGLVPSNLAGLNFGASMDMVSVNLLYANAYNGAAEENSYGAVVSLSPMPEIGLNVGFLTEATGTAATATTAATNSGDLLNVVLTGTVKPSSDMSLTYALEYIDMESIDTAWGATANVMHGNHGLTVRYDTISGNAGAPDPTSLTVALICQTAENLRTAIEYRTDDSDIAGSSSTDILALQFVTTF